MNRILSLVGWLGIALVVAARRRSASACPAKDQYADYLAWRRAWSAVLIYIARPVARIRDALQRAVRRATARSPASACSIVLGILVAINYIGASRTSAGTSRRTRSSASRTRRGRCSRSSTRRWPITVFAQESDFPALSGSAEGIPVRVEESVDGVHRSRQEAGSRQAEPGAAVRHGGVRLQGPHRAHHDATPSRT